MGKTSQHFELLIENWVLETQNNQLDDDYLYQEYREQKEQELNNQMETFFNNYLNYEN